MATKTNTTHETLITGTSAADSIKNYGGKVTISTGNGDDTVYNEYDNNYKDEENKIDSAEFVSINTGEGNDSVYNYFGSECTINTGAGNDSVYNLSNECTINTGAGNDSVYNYYGWDCTINTGEGNDSVYNDWVNDCTINTGAGNDSVYNYWIKDCTINTGAGNDLISLDSGSNYNVIIYNSGDGNDIIYGFDGDDTLKISGGSYSTAKSGNNVIVTVGDGKITLFGAANLSEVNINGTKTSTPSTETTKWTFDGTTAKYGTSSKTLFTVNGVKSLDGIKVSDKVVTVSKEALGTSKVTISDGYTLKLGSDVTKPSTKSAGWTYSNSTAIYKTDSTTAGYKLANNQITYTAASGGKDLVTVKGVKSKDGLKLNGKVVTVAKSSLGTSVVTVSDGYTLKLGSDVKISKSTGTGWTKNGTTATYKTASTTEGYKLANNKISYIYASGGKTSATVKGANSTNGLSLNGNIITLNKKSLNSKVTVSGNYEFNFASGDYKKTSIMGSSSGDIITSRGKNLSINGGTGNDTIKMFGSNTTVTGGDGKDVFVYKGSGNNKITDFSANDMLKIGDNGKGTYSTTENGKDLIVTVGDSSITLVGAAKLSLPKITGTKTEEKTKGDKNIVVEGKKVTLLEDYSSESFVLAENSSMLTVDASAIMLDMKITGNKFMNSILGGNGNDTFIGGKGNDTLTGQEGSDVFIWNSGDGNDIITDYTEEDRIIISSGTLSENNFSTSGDNVILNVEGNKITVEGAKDKIVTCVDNKGNEISYFNEVIIKKNTATLTDKYNKKKFDVTICGSDIRTIDASAVERPLIINGGNKADLIIGTDYDDTIYGGRGGDSLQGGNGNNIFVYSKGDGNDFINDYKSGDKISIASGAVSDAVTVEGSNVIFSVDGGKIVVEDGKGEKITLIDNKGNETKKIYTKSTMLNDLWFTNDDNNFNTAQLSTIVKNSDAAYSLDENYSNLSIKSSIPAITYSGRK